jgi:hypothetical protein
MMRNSVRLGAAVLFGFALLALGGRNASAGTMFAGTGFNSSPYTSILNGIPGDPINPEQQPASDYFSAMNSTGSVGANISTLGAIVKSYAIDLFQAVDRNVVDLANVSATATTNDPDASGFPRNIGAAGWIVDNYGVNLGVINTSAAWTALEAAAGVNPANVTYLEQVAVLQTAIWVKAYGPTSASISGSEGGTTNADANGLLTRLLAVSGSNTATVGFIDYPLPAIAGGFNNQDQIFLQTQTPSVPEPCSLALLGLGALGVLGYTWKRRKRPDPGLIVRT